MFNRFKNIQVYASPPFALPEVAMVSRITVISSTGAQKMRASYPTRARFEPMFNRFKNIQVYASPPFALRALPEVAMVSRIAVIFEHRSAENARQLPTRARLNLCLIGLQTSGFTHRRLLPYGLFQKSLWCVE
jgi:hypothetical protein